MIPTMVRNFSDSVRVIILASECSGSGGLIGGTFLLSLTAIEYSYNLRFRNEFGKGIYIKETTVSFQRVYVYRWWDIEIYISALTGRIRVSDAVIKFRGFNLSHTEPKSLSSA
jgi:hypothetical protein